VIVSHDCVPKFTASAENLERYLLAAFSELNSANRYWRIFLDHPISILDLEEYINSIER